MGRATLVYIAAVAVFTTVLAGCGGGDGEGEGGAVRRIDSPPPPPAPPPEDGTGTLRVTVNDPDGIPIAGISVRVTAQPCCSWSRTLSTGNDGVAEFQDIPPSVSVVAKNPFGVGYGLDPSGAVSVHQDGQITSFSLSLRFDPAVIVFSGMIDRTSMSADGSGFWLRARLATAERPPLLHGYLVFVCEGSVECEAFRHDESGQTVPLRLVAGPRQDPLGPPLEFADYAGGAHDSVMLLIDQGRGMHSDEDAPWRGAAVRHFIRRMPEGDKMAIAGFAGADSVPWLPALLPQLPVWTATSFSNDRRVLEAGAAQLLPLIGGASPVLESLHASTTQLSPDGLGRSRAIVLVAGDGADWQLDGAGAGELQALRSRQDSEGIHTIVVPAEKAVRNSPVSRTSLFELAALAHLLEAPMVYAQKEFRVAGHLWGQLHLVSALRTGALRHYELDVRITVSDPRDLVPGSTLIIPVSLYNGDWDNYHALNFYVTAQIP